MASFQDVTINEMQQVEGGSFLSWAEGYVLSHPAEVSYAIDVALILL